MRKIILQMRMSKVEMGLIMVMNRDQLIAGHYMLMGKMLAGSKKGILGQERGHFN
jgi:hypothetical protein